MIPLVDLRKNYGHIKADVDAAIQAVLDDCQFYKGPHVERFEKEFAEYLGVDYCVGVGNCTDALYLALRAFGIGDGHEVIVPAMTFIATAEAVTMTGARPVFVDIDPATYNIDLGKIEAAITKRTRAIIPVHLFGHAVDMPQVMEIAKAHGLKVIEDCAQAVGAEWDSRKVGTWGDAGCFSFYPSKNLGAYGDGGAVVTNSVGLDMTVRMTADHGRRVKYEHMFAGVSSRLDALQAAVLSAKLPYLDIWNFKRYNCAWEYWFRLHDTPGITLPNSSIGPGLSGIEKQHERRGHVFHCFVVRVKNRARVRAALAEKGIETGIHYPTAIPFTPAYVTPNSVPEDFPEAYAFSRECLSLPCYPDYDLDDINYVANSLREAVNA